jgi:EAL domain-containing protein (putative c-di-GMP-specific phosphodiesterase class I)
LPVFAAGIETKEQFDFLSQLGCDKVQAYLFSKLVIAHTILLLLEQRRAVA